MWDRSFNNDTQSYFLVVLNLIGIYFCGLFHHIALSKTRKYVILQCTLYTPQNNLRTTK